MTALQLQHANLVETARANRERERITRDELAIKEAQAERDVALDAARLRQLGYQTAASAASYGDNLPGKQLRRAEYGLSGGWGTISDVDLELKGLLTPLTNIAKLVR